MNPAMWLKAVRVIPRLSAEEWARLDFLSRWLIATRSAVVVMTVTASTEAGLLAWRDGAFHLGRWLAVTSGLMLAHATNNLLNDLIDHHRGVDEGNYFRTQYGPQPLEHGLMTRGQLLAWALGTGALAVAIGLWLGFTQGGVVWPLFAVGLGLVVFYTWPLKGIGLGEVAVMAVWGPLMVGGGYAVVTGAWSWPVCAASLPIALGATAVLFGKHIDKLPADRDKGVRTLPVILGEAWSRRAVQGMLGVQYGLVVWLVASGWFTPTLLVVGAALPAARTVLSAYQRPYPAARPPEVPADIWPLYFSAYAFWHTRRFGGLFLLGLLADTMWRRLA